MLFHSLSVDGSPAAPRPTHKSSRLLTGEQTHFPLVVVERDAAAAPHADDPRLNKQADH